jgi:hypothetical protein
VPTSFSGMDCNSTTSHCIVSPGPGRRVPDDEGTEVCTFGTEQKPCASGPLDTLDDRLGMSCGHEPVDDYLSTDYVSGEGKYHRTFVVNTRECASAVDDIFARSLARERRVSKIA